MKTEALLYLVPAAEFYIIGDELTWLDSRPQPSQSEVEAIESALLDFEPIKKANQTAQAYLSSTDWYVVRMQETGQAVPADVATKRQEARETIKTFEEFLDERA